MNEYLKYDDFISFLKKEIESSDNNELNDFETIVEFFQDFPPESLEDIDSEYAKEEIERIARAEILILIPKLLDNESTWLVVEDGKLRLSSSQVERKPKKGFKYNLNDEELKLISLHYDKLGKNERGSVLRLYELKLSKFGTVEEKFEVLENLYNSYEYLDEKDYNYLKVLDKISEFSLENKDKEFYKRAHLYYESSAKFHRKRYDHDESAKKFQDAVCVLNDLIDSCVDEDVEAYYQKKLKLVRAMRIQYEMAGDEISASKAFIEENKLSRKIKGKSEKSWIHMISDNCQNPLKVANAAFWLVLFSTLIFSLSGISTSNIEQSLFVGNKEWYLVIWDSFYFSVVTFTTLGYGDFSPGIGFSRLVANAVSVLGLLLSSLFLVTLVRKYGR
ncbi:potassium channel family protein [Aliivibrio wodanis]|uniref:potassium channel family protein n=1 Tax=Aliivibrio wodanis TaxID=80852 RepID=UPI00406C7CAA